MIRLSAVFAATISALGPTWFVRPSGSFIEGQSRDKKNGEAGKEIAEWLGTLDWTDVTDDAWEKGVAKPGCSYFRAEVPEEFVAWEAAALLTELSEEELTKVRARIGHHKKPELYAEGMEPRPTNEIHLIIGDYEGNDVVYTWYPGRITPPYQTVKFD